jgi:hypothetical protein
MTKVTRSPFDCPIFVVERPQFPRHIPGPDGISIQVETELVP